MKFGVFSTISGNIDALIDADRQFDAFGVDAKICLGHVVGIYPFVDDCVELLIDRNYVVLRMLHDDGFLGYCEGKYDFEGWSTINLVDALKFTSQWVSKGSLEFIRQLPQRRVINGIAFEGIANVEGGYVYDPDKAAAAFSTWKHNIVIHAARLDPYVWHEDLTGNFLSPGRNQFEPQGRLLISPGVLGRRRAGTIKWPAAAVFDDQARSVHLLQTKYDARLILPRLRAMEYPAHLLKHLEEWEVV